MEKEEDEEERAYVDSCVDDGLELFIKMRQCKTVFHYTVL